MEYPYEYESELRNSYLADVYGYMQSNDVSKEDAEKVITELYEKNNWFSIED